LEELLHGVGAGTLQECDWPMESPPQPPSEKPADQSSKGLPAEADTTPAAASGKDPATGGSAQAQASSRSSRDRDLWTDACKSGEDVLFYSINQARMRVLKNKIGLLELYRYVFCRQFFFLSSMGKLSVCADKATKYLQLTKAKIDRMLQLQLIERQFALAQQQTQQAQQAGITLTPTQPTNMQLTITPQKSNSPEMFGISNSALMENAPNTTTTTNANTPVATALLQASAPPQATGPEAGTQALAALNQMVCMFADYFDSHIDVRRKQADVFIVCAAVKIVRTLRELLLQAINANIQQSAPAHAHLLAQQQTNAQHLQPAAHDQSFMGGGMSMSMSRALSPSPAQTRANLLGHPSTSAQPGTQSNTQPGGSQALSPPKTSALAGYSYAAPVPEHPSAHRSMSMSTRSPPPSSFPEQANSRQTAGTTAGPAQPPSQVSMSLLGSLSVARDLVTNTNNSNNIVMYTEVARHLSELLTFAAARLYTVSNCADVSPLLSARIQALQQLATPNTAQISDALTMSNRIYLLADSNSSSVDDGSDEVFLHRQSRGNKSAHAHQNLNCAKSYRALALHMACVCNTWDDADAIAHTNPAAVKYFNDFNSTQTAAAATQTATQQPDSTGTQPATAASSKKVDISELITCDILDTLLSYSPRVRGLMNCAWPMSFLNGCLQQSNAQPPAQTPPGMLNSSPYLSTSPTRTHAVQAPQLQQAGNPPRQAFANTHGGGGSVGPGGSGSFKETQGMVVSDAALAARIIEKVSLECMLRCLILC
jgi:hypothetical protein